MLSVGLLTGYGLIAVGEDAVTVPLVGEVAGVGAGAVALATAAALYTQVGGGADGCGCAGDCGDSCSVDS